MRQYITTKVWVSKGMALSGINCISLLFSLSLLSISSPSPLHPLSSAVLSSPHVRMELEVIVLRRLTRVSKAEGALKTLQSGLLGLLQRKFEGGCWKLLPTSVYRSSGASLARTEPRMAKVRHARSRAGAIAKGSCRWQMGAFLPTSSRPEGRTQLCQWPLRGVRGSIFSPPICDVGRQPELRTLTGNARWRMKNDWRRNSLVLHVNSRKSRSAIDSLVEQEAVKSAAVRSSTDV